MLDIERNPKTSDFFTAVKNISQTAKKKFGTKSPPRAKLKHTGMPEQEIWPDRNLAPRFFKPIKKTLPSNHFICLTINYRSGLAKICSGVPSIYLHVL